MELPSGVLGNAIKMARLEKNISQESLSEMIGITPTHIKHIESEHRRPFLEVLYGLVRVLNISLDDIFFPERVDGSELRRKAKRLLGDCDEKQVKIVIAALEAILSPD